MKIPSGGQIEAEQDQARRALLNAKDTSTDALEEVNTIPELVAV